MGAPSQSDDILAARFTPDELARIVSDTFIDRVDYHATIESTNDRAKKLAADAPSDATCVLVLAEEQTGGRGRGANRWWSAAGGLTFSVLLGRDALDLPPDRLPRLSLATGLAVCEAIESVVPGLAAQIKWPNDVYLSSRKVSGILVETGRGGRIVIGIGVNVNNSAQSAPAELRDKLIALCDATASTIHRADLLVAILQRLTTQLDRLRDNTGKLVEDWQRRSLLTGRTVELELPARRIAGRCRGIDGDGALVVETDAGIERSLSAVIARFE